MIRILLLLINISIFAQGLINNGANIIITSNANIYIDGDANGGFTNSGSGEIESDGKISLEGNWINNGSGNVFINRDNTGEVEFSGSANQELGGSQKTAFENLTVNNGNSVYLTQNTDINYNLTMTNGKLDLKDKTIDLGTTGDIVNETETNSITSTDGSGVIGNNTGTITATRTVSNVSNYNPAHLGIIITTPDNLGTITIIRGHKIQTGSFGGTPTSGVARYYEVPGIGKLDVNAGKKVDMYYWDSELNGLTESQIEGYHWVTEGSSSSWWTPLDGSVDVGNNLFTTSGDPYDSYFTTSTWYGFTWSDKFTLGSKQSPLPITLIDFSYRCDNSEIDINWTTSSEINNDYFILEKSTDGIYYQEIAEISGAGNSNNTNKYNFTDYNYEGIAYYRLIQVDYNGDKTFFKPIYTNCNSNNNSAIILYPNPAKNKVNIKLNNLNNIESVIITDVVGKQLFKEKIINNDNIIINTQSLAKGAYNVTIITKNNKYTKQLIIN